MPSFVEKLGHSLQTTALVIATSTVSGSAWFLGGAIPHARLLLLVGAITATFVGQCGWFLCRGSNAREFDPSKSRRKSNQQLAGFAKTGISSRTMAGIPLCVWALLGLAVLCIVQLLPLYSPSITRIQHAVRSDLLTETLADYELPASGPRSVMPCETRLYLGQFLALSLISATVYQCSRTVRHVRVILGILTLNSCLMAVFALGQSFGARSVVIGNQWKVSSSTPFGCFVNPNNAAGWFLVCLVCAFVLAANQFERSSTPESRYAAMLGPTWWRDLIARVANLSAPQVLCVVAVVLLIATPIATLSRGGIVATSITLVVILLSRTRRKDWLVFLAGFILLILLAVLAVALFDLDTYVIKELQTLKDPVSESTARFLHWADTLPIVADFPLIGTGMGSYRYSTLPYQRHYWATWFQRADNQLFELLVEGGIIGLLLILSTGATVLYRAIQICFVRPTKPVTDVVSWLATGTIAIILGIGSASILDYGISLPSVSGVVVILWGLFESSTRIKEIPESTGTSWHLPLLGCLLSLASIPLLNDAYFAANVYNASAECQRFLQLPPSDAAFTRDTLKKSSKALATALSSRPDDLEGLRVLSQMRQLEWQEACFELLAAGHGVSPGTRMNVVPKLSFIAIADHLSQHQDEIYSQLMTLVAAVSNDVPWGEDARKLQAATQWIPDLNYGLVFFQLAHGAKPRREALQLAVLMDPAGAREAYVLGALLKKSGDALMADQIWKQCLAVSERFRPEILVESAVDGDSASAMKNYGPGDYESCVACAERLGQKHPLYQQILDTAESLWPDWSRSLTPRKALLRSRQLMLRDPGSSILWLTKALEKWPYESSLRIARAKQFEATGRYLESYDDWLTIYAQEPQNKDASIALDRLVRLIE